MQMSEVAYSELLPGDVVKEYDTLFVVTGVKSFKRREVTVWLVSTVAITEPSRILGGPVKGVGDTWDMQASAITACTARVSFVVDEASGGTAGVYRRTTQAVIDGSPCRVEYRISESRHASVWVLDLSTGEEMHSFGLGPVKGTDLPGLAQFSRTLGKLIRF